MTSEAKALTEMKERPPNHLLEKMKQHGELIAAIMSGILIFFGWLLSKFDVETASVIVYLSAFLIGGYAKGKEGIIDTIENKKLNVEILMILAAIGSAIIGYWAEGAILIFIFAMSGALETYTLNKSHKEISALMELQPQEAIVIQGNEEKTVPVSQLEIGDLILIKPGDRVSADGVIVKGQSHIDESTITGESIPVTKGVAEEVFAGTVNLDGSITVEVSKKSSDSLFQKIIELVQSAQSEKSPAQLFIEKFEGTYVKVVLIVVFIMMFLPHYVLGWSWTETFYRAMILLVVSSPCALVASITPATLSAISNGARHGILFKGGVHLETLKFIRAIAFDKTGTLTKGKPEVTDCYVKEGIQKEELLTKVASIESHSNHPLANAIVNYVKDNVTDEFILPESITDVAGYGVKAYYGSDEWKIGKGDFVGKEQATNFLDGIAKKIAANGKTVVFVQLNGEVVACIGLKDVVREETKRAIKRLKEQGIHTVMLTGDSESTAKAIANEARLDAYVAECLPEQKVEELKKLKQRYGHVAMVGDGVNDAPALATASVGISMGDGSGVALETADVVLMKNDLQRIGEAISLSDRMNRIIKQNIIFSITVIIFLICTNFLQVLDLPLGVIGHEGSTILVILNGLRLLK